METNVITKFEIIEALSEKTKMLSKRKSELISLLFEAQKAAELQILKLAEHDIIDIEEWDIDYIEGKYENHMTYKHDVISTSGGFYDRGDFNYWIPPCNYKRLVEFVLKSEQIISGMQKQLEENLNKIKDCLRPHINW